MTPGQSYYVWVQSLTSFPNVFSGLPGFAVNSSTAGPYQTNFSKPTVSVFRDATDATPSAIALSVTPASGDAVNPALQFSIQGTMDVDGTHTLIPTTQASGSTGNAFIFTINSLPPNAHITNIQIQLGSSTPGTPASNWSLATSATTTGPIAHRGRLHRCRLVKPNIPSSIQAEATAMTMAFDLATNNVVPASNPADTIYRLEVTPDPSGEFQRSRRHICHFRLHLYERPSLGRSAGGIVLRPG